MPGFFDAHGHIDCCYGTGAMPQKHAVRYAALAYGVTTNFDPYANELPSYETGEMTIAGLMVSPRWLTTGHVIYGRSGKPDRVFNRIRNLEDARATALALREDGWDAEVFPVQAYSTLGWFSDPLLSSMLSLSMPELVELILHEITHRTLFIPSRGQLNEGFATHMGREGARLFFLAHPEAAGQAELKKYRQARQLDSQYKELISRLKTDLETLYRGAASRENKLARKKELFASATRAARELLQADTITLASNARVVASETYTAQLALLERLQEKTGGHPRRLLEVLREARADGKLNELLAAETQ
jgi:predicted aminopeptidase